MAEARCAALEQATAEERRGREDAVRAAGEVQGSWCMVQAV